MRDATATGAVLILAGMVMLGFTDNLVRLISSQSGLWQFHLLRSAMALPILCCAALLFRLPLRPRRPLVVAARSACQTLSMLLYFGALPMMPIAQVGAALFTAPIWVSLLSYAFFGHPVTRRGAAAVLLGFAGVLVMLRPDPANLSALTLMPLAAGALYGLSNLLTREWCREEPTGALVAGFFGGLAIASACALAILAFVSPPAHLHAAAPFLLDGWRAPHGSLLFWILIQAAGSLLAITLIARGYQSGETAVLAVYEYAFILTASLFAWLLWGEALRPPDLAGIAMILASGVVMASRPNPPQT